MKQRIITGLLFTLGVAVLVLPGFRWPILPILFFTLIAVVGSHELRSALRARSIELPVLTTTAGSVLFLAVLIVTGLAPLELTAANYQPVLVKAMALLGFVLLSATTWVAVYLLIRGGPPAIPSGLAAASLIHYLGFPLGCAVMILMIMPWGMLWLIIALMAPWFSDMFAYFTGSAIGRNPICPQISPKKTVEGTVGGIVGSMLSLALFFFFIMRQRSGLPGSVSYNLLFALGSGLLLSVASQLGDWLASGVKRWCGIKDFSNIFPGHGGILDRFDSVLFTLPATLFLAVAYLYLAP